METLNSPSDKVLYQAIMEIKEPVIFQRLLQNAKNDYCWKLFEWNLSELAEKFGDIKLPFRVGYNARSTVNCYCYLIYLFFYILFYIYIYYYYNIYNLYYYNNKFIINLKISYVSESTMGSKLSDSFNDTIRIYSKYESP